VSTVEEEEPKEEEESSMSPVSEDEMPKKDDENDDQGSGAGMGQSREGADPGSGSYDQAKGSDESPKEEKSSRDDSKHSHSQVGLLFSLYSMII
jgi:hypothetical protein